MCSFELGEARQVLKVVRPRRGCSEATLGRQEANETPSAVWLLHRGALEETLHRRMCSAQDELRGDLKNELALGDVHGAGETPNKDVVVSEEGGAD
jgi:hypothetical protein